MRLASLGSGSRGNGTLIEDGTTRLLIDLGFSVKETTARLQRLGVVPSSIDALLVTHEHADHVSGVEAFAQRFGIPVHMTHGTHYSCSQRTERKKGDLLPMPEPVVSRFNAHSDFMVGSIRVEPVAVPHDAREPCQFIFESGGLRVGILTDIGHLTPHVKSRYQELDALLLECNYDRRMLAEGPYPRRLKERVAGIHGHLSNEQALELLGHVNTQRLRHLIISHISEKNNLPALATETVSRALDNWQGSLEVADQDNGADWRSVS